MSDNGTNATGSVNITILDSEMEQGLPLFAVVTITLMIIAMLFIMAGNLLVLTAILRFQTLQNITGIFVANLAFADLITGLQHPFQIAFFFFPDIERNKCACLLRYGIILFACNASTFSLVCTVVDRYIAIAFPLRYPNIMTKDIAYGLVIAIWAIDVCVLLPMFTVNNWETAPFCLYEFVMDKYYRACIHLSTLLFGLCMFCIYVRIFLIVRKHMRQIQNEAFPFQLGQMTQGAKQMNTVVSIVVLLFHIAWLPFCIIELTMLEVENITKEKVQIANFLVFLGVLNSVVNPIVYAWKNKQYRRAFKKLLGLKAMSEDSDVVTYIT